MPILAIFLVLLAIFVILPLVGILVWWLVWNAIIGIALGGLARLIIPGEQPIGVMQTVVSGWLGSLVGGGIAAIAFHGYHHHWLGTLLIQVGVAAVAVLAFSAGSRNKSVKGGHHHKIIDI